MGCFVALFALISPRLALIVVWLFTNWLDRAYDEWVVPFIGFFLLPWTTLAYAAMWVSGGREVTGFEWFIVILAFLADLSSYSAGSRMRPLATERIAAGDQAAKRWTARARRFSASTSRFFGGAEVTRASRRFRVARVTSSTARSKASAFACDGLLEPLTLRTY